MTYYDHATFIALKLGRWSDQPQLRGFELEAIAREQARSDTGSSRLPFSKRIASAIRTGRLSSPRQQSPR